MYSFENDYSEGAHPRILKALVDTNFNQTTGYGFDEYSQQAVSILKQKLNRDDIDIYFVSGGTQANLVCISAWLKPYEAVIASYDGHIATDEAGAIEATGHKVISEYSKTGKLTAKIIEKVINEHDDFHKVVPRMVYISNSSDIGTIYSKDDLLEIRRCCNKHELLFYLDGARIGSALSSDKNDLRMSDLCEIFDAFYIGGTKVGALLGEAIVIVNDNLKHNFRYNIKQKGALFAKGKIIALQFIELFKDDLYFKLSSHANKMANLIKEAFVEAGYKFYSDSSTNLQFVIMPNELLRQYNEKFLTSVYKKYDDNNSIVRFVTSWATKEEEVLKLVEYIKNNKII